MQKAMRALALSEAEQQWVTDLAFAGGNPERVEALRPDTVPEVSDRDDDIEDLVASIVFIALGVTELKVESVLLLMRLVMSPSHFVVISWTLFTNLV